MTFKFGGIRIRRVTEEPKEDAPAFRSAIEEYQYKRQHAPPPELLPWQSLSPTGMVQIVPHCIREGSGMLERCQNCGEETEGARKWWHTSGLCARKRIDSPAVTPPKEGKRGDKTTQTARDKSSGGSSGNSSGGSRRRRTRARPKRVRRKR